MVAVLLIRRLIPPKDRRDLGSVRNLVVVLSSAVLADPAVGALIAAATVPEGDLATRTAFWIGWWVGDAIGILVVAPVLLVLAERRRPEQSWGLRWLGLVLLLATTTLGPLRPVEGGQGVYILLPVLVLVAFKEDARTTAAAVAVVGFGANAATLWGYGPFAEPDRPFVGRINAQIFVGTLAFSALFVSVLSANLIRRDKAETMLRDQARTDQLTGVGNRRMLFERLGDIRANGLVGARDRIALLLLDLDGFKQVNDTFGHAAGDLGLRTTAERLSATTRSDEIVVRLGGDEFLVCLTKAPSSDETRALAGRVAAQLAEPIEVGGGQSVTVGVSIGVAEGLWGDFDVDDLLRRADEAMYVDKHGRAPEPA